VRVVWVAACVAALACAACATHVVVPPTTDDFPLYKKSPGYYPGIANVISPGTALEAWLEQNRAGIDDIQQRIVGIREGRAPAGCIGENKYTCVAALAQRFAVADSYLSKDNNVFSPRRRDVNGKLLEDKIELYGFVPRGAGAEDPLHIEPYTKFELTPDGSDSISTLRALLPADPALAKTQEEYDATHAYETVAAITAKNCPNLDRTEVAKWIENTIKPNSKSYRGRVYRGVGRAQVSPQAKFCGRTFKFESVWASRTSNQYGTDVIGGMFVYVE
jgi:hypothetical protein